MMMLVFAVEKVNKDVSYWFSVFVLFPINEATVNKWVRKIINCHSVVVKAKSLVDVQFFLFNLLWCSFDLSLDVHGFKLWNFKDSNLENTVIKVWHCEHSTLLILLDFLHLDIATLIIFFKRADIVLEGVLLDLITKVARLRDGNGRLRVISNDAAHYGVVCLHVLRTGKPTENVVEVLKTLVRLYVLVSVGAQSQLLLLHFDHGAVSINFFQQVCFRSL